MISALILSLAVSVLTMIFSFFPQVLVLPTIANVNLDTVIVGGIASLFRIAELFWYITAVVQGFLFIMGYYVIKMTFKFLAGLFQGIGGSAIN